MAIRNNNMLYSMLSTWEEIRTAGPSGVLQLCQGWLKYAYITYLHLSECPPCIIEACLRKGPAKRMSERDITALLSFFH